MQKTWLLSRSVKNRQLEKFGKGALSPCTTYQWLGCGGVRFFVHRWCAIPAHVFFFLVHFPLWLSVIFLHIHQSGSQSSLLLTLVLRGERVSLLCSIAFGLLTSRREGEVSAPARGVMSKKVSCQEGAGCSALPASPAASQLSLHGVCGTGSARHSEAPSAQRREDDECALPGCHHGHDLSGALSTPGKPVP